MNNQFHLRARNIFLTGATGVLGAHLLKEILASTDAHVHCLVRASSPEEGRHRVQNLLRAYDPRQDLWREHENRVHVVLGDIVHENFGLAPSDYEALCAKVDATLHAAASTNLFANLRQMEPVNVGGVRTVIDFVLRTASRYLCFISTYTVLGDRVFDPSFRFREEHFDVGQKFPFMAYQETKFRAESLVREATSRGLRWNIIRPGQIFGETKTGHYPQGQVSVSGLFLDIFKTVIETGVAIRSDLHFDVTPVDFVSRGTLQLGLVQEKFYETYHLVNPHVCTYTEVIETIASFGYPIRFVSQDDYKIMLFGRELKADGKEYRSATIRSFKWWFRRELFNFSQSAIVDANYTASVLREAGIECAPIDQKLLGTYLQYGLERGYFPAPPVRDASVEVTA